MPRRRPRVTLHEATPHDAPLLRRLLRRYFQELAAIDGREADPESLLAEVARAERRCTAPDGWSFLVRADAAVAGFVLILDEARFGGRGTREINEFFVLPEYRRRGVGEQAARSVFDRFRGRWETAQMASNAPAQAFWRAVIGRYTGDRFQDADRRLGTWQGAVQTFRSPAGAPGPAQPPRTRPPGRRARRPRGDAAALTSPDAAATLGGVRRRGPRPAHGGPRSG